MYYFSIIRGCTHAHVIMYIVHSIINIMYALCGVLLDLIFRSILRAQNKQDESFKKRKITRARVTRPHCAIHTGMAPGEKHKTSSHARTAVSCVWKKNPWTTMTDDN